MPAPDPHPPQFSAAAQPRLPDRVREKIRLLHYAKRTEEAYVGWIRKFILFHGKRHPDTMGAPEVEQFLTHWAVVQHVAASTQNQALCAILFLYKVLEQPLPLLDAVRAKRPDRLPTVLSVEGWCQATSAGRLGNIGKESSKCVVPKSAMDSRFLSDSDRESPGYPYWMESGMAPFPAPFPR